MNQEKQEANQALSNFLNREFVLPKSKAEELDYLGGLVKSSVLSYEEKDRHEGCIKWIRMELSHLRRRHNEIRQEIREFIVTPVAKELVELKMELDIISSITGLTEDEIKSIS